MKRSCIALSLLVFSICSCPIGVLSNVDALIRNNHPRAALMALKAAACSSEHVFQAGTSVLSKDMQAASAFFLHCEKLDPGNGWPKLRLCYIFQLQGDLTAAESYCLAALERSNSDISLVSSILTNLAGIKISAAQQADTELERDAILEQAVAFAQRGVLADPSCVSCHSNLGLAFFRLRQFLQCVAPLSVVLSMDPAHESAYTTLVSVYRSLRRGNDALVLFRDRLILIESHRELFADPEMARLRAYTGVGMLQRSLRNWEAAVVASKLALEAARDIRTKGSALLQEVRELESQALTAYCDCARMQMDWSRQGKCLNDIVTAQRSSERVLLTSFEALLLPVSNSLIRRIGALETTGSKEVPLTELEMPELRQLLVDTEGALRVVYMSNDFREHPIGFLSVPLFSHHNRSRVSVIAAYTGISHPPNINWLLEALWELPVLDTAVDDGEYSIYGSEGRQSKWRSGVAASVDNFVDLGSLRKGLRALRMLEALLPHIFVDLQGFLAGYQPSLVNARAAPIVVNYLGYPGTTGSSRVE